MLVCPICGKEIRYIATGYNKVEICEPEKVTIVTINGHHIDGYLPHLCQKEDDEVNNE